MMVCPLKRDTRVVPRAVECGLRNGAVDNGGGDQGSQSERISTQIADLLVFEAPPRNQRREKPAPESTGSGFVEREHHQK